MEIAWPTRVHPDVVSGCVEAVRVIRSLDEVGRGVCCWAAV